MNPFGYPNTPNYAVHATMGHRTSPRRFLHPQSHGSAAMTPAEGLRLPPLPQENFNFNNIPLYMEDPYHGAPAFTTPGNANAENGPFFHGYPYQMPMHPGGPAVAQPPAQNSLISRLENDTAELHSSDEEDNLPAKKGASKKKQNTSNASPGRGRGRGRGGARGGARGRGRGRGGGASANKVVEEEDEKVPVPKKTGKGSKSHGNRREQGASDDNAEDLTDAEAEAATADIKRNWSEPDKLKVVEYICEPERYATFKENREKYFVAIAQDVLQNRKTSAQVKGLWDGMWEKYKHCRRCEQHTGGGDGDTASASEDEQSKEEDVVGDAGEASENAVTDEHEVPQLGQKRKASDSLTTPMPKAKKAAKSSAPQAYSRNGPSKRMLDKFLNSPFYALIDSV